jgi:hypothetical protein
MLRRNYLLKRVIEGKIGESIAATGRRRRRGKQLTYDVQEKKKVLEIERGNTRSHSVVNSLRKRLWTLRKTDNRMKDDDR